MLNVIVFTLVVVVFLMAVKSIIKNRIKNTTCGGCKGCAGVCDGCPNTKNSESDASD